MTKPFDDYKQKVVSEYERVYLKPQFGEGTIKKGLLEGLVSTLNNFSEPTFLHPNVEKKDRNSREINYSHLEKPINYEKMLIIEYDKGLNGCAKRIKNIFRNIEVETPLDIIKLVYKGDKASGGYRDWQTYDGKEVYKKILGHWRQFGGKSADVLMDYLESEGFDFSKEYAEKVMETVGKKK